MSGYTDVNCNKNVICNKIDATCNKKADTICNKGQRNL